jgi:hypothetical protein
VHILFDQGTPNPLRKLLTPHRVETAFERGWSTLKNTELLLLAEQEGFQVLVTTDKNLPYRQNPGGRRIAIVVLSTTSWQRIEKAVATVKHGIGTALPGSIREVQIP